MFYDDGISALRTAEERAVNLSCFSASDLFPSFQDFVTYLFILDRVRVCVRAQAGGGAVQGEKENPQADSQLKSSWTLTKPFRSPSNDLFITWKECGVASQEKGNQVCPVTNGGGHSALQMWYSPPFFLSTEEAKV